MISPPSNIEVVQTSRMDMAVRFRAGTPISAEVAARWRACRPASGAVEDVAENRFSMGWARRPHEPFRSLGECWPNFAGELGALQHAFIETGAGEPTFAECELTYVNPVTVEEQSLSQGRLERLLVRWLVPDPGDGWLRPPEGVVADATFPMSASADGTPGRLCVRMQSLSTETAEPLFGMTLSAHCAVGSPRLDDLEAAFEVGFDWIIRGYATLGDRAVAGR